MFILKDNNTFRTVGVRLTRSLYNYEFAIDAVHLRIYSNSPYYKGAHLSNGLPNHV